MTLAVPKMNTQALYWVPHPVHLWGLARYSSKDVYILEYPLDTEANEEGLVLNLEEASLKTIASSFSDISDTFKQALTQRTFSNLISPVSNLDDLQAHDNICHLSYVCEASVLHVIRKRYVKDLIYINIGNIVVSLNPFRRLEALYSPKTIAEYTEASNPFHCRPHIFQIGSAAYKGLSLSKSSHSILITGDSGSGKTESTKLILQFLTFCSSRNNAVMEKLTSTDKTDSRLSSRQSSRMGAAYSLSLPSQTPNRDGSVSLEQRLLQANILLEAFGNAKTSRNLNSSRFGKWIQIHFEGMNNFISGAHITSYLLELPRVTEHAPNEQGYHIFYVLLFALEKDIAALAHSYNLVPGVQGINTYKYLKSNDSIVLDLSISLSSMPSFRDIRNAMLDYRLDYPEQDSIFSIIAAVLHIGNIQFDETADRDKVSLSADSQTHLQAASRLLQIDATLMNYFLENRNIQTGGECIRKPLNLTEASAARDSFSKLIYDSFFTWLIYKLNNNLNGRHAENDKSFIGILDVAGFETFAVNGLEQLCINYSNEKLQHQFNEDVFRSELETLTEEGIEHSTITYNDNSNVLQTFESRTGIFVLLAEEMLVPRGSDLNFVSKLLQISVNNSCISKSKIREPHKFSVVHYADTVEYTVNGWLDKNKMTPPILAVQALKTSVNQVLQSMVSNCHQFNATSKATDRTTVTQLFQMQLTTLLTKIRSTTTHYIRCIKPNLEVLPRTIDAREVIRQLTCCGVMQAIKIRKSGFALRMKHKDFVVYYGIIYGRRFSRLTTMKNTVEACRILIDHAHTALGLPLDGMVIGRSRVLITQDVHESLDNYRRLSLSTPAIKIQTAFRGYIARKHYRKSLELSHGLTPLLQIDKSMSSQKQGCLYPTPLIAGVVTPHDLLNYVNATEEFLVTFLDMPPVFQPPALPKAMAIFENIKKEAVLLTEIEALLNSNSTHIGKLSTLLEKTKQCEWRHPLVIKLEKLVNQLEYELSISSEAEYMYQNPNHKEKAQYLLSQIEKQLKLNDFTECLTKPMKRLVVHLSAQLQDPRVPAPLNTTDTKDEKCENLEIEAYDDTARSDTEQDSIDEQNTKKKSFKGVVSLFDPTPSVSEKSIPTAHALVRDLRKSGTETSDELSSSTSLSTSLSSWSSSTYNAHEAQKRGNKRENTEHGESSSQMSMTKFNKELKTALCLFDVKRLDFLLNSYEEKVTPSQHPNRHYTAAKEVRSQLDNKDWITSEIKKAMLAVVWGKNEETNFQKLNNLLAYATELGIDNEDVSSARRTVATLCVSSPSLTQNPIPADTAEMISVIPQANFIDYPGLLVNQRVQHIRRPILRFLQPLRERSPKHNKKLVCSHTYGQLEEPLTIESKSCDEYSLALKMFLMVQRYMGDRYNTSREDLADYIIHLTISRPSLRAELYLQLMKSKPFPWLDPHVVLLLSCFATTSFSTMETSEGVLHEISEVAHQALNALTETVMKNNILVDEHQQQEEQEDKDPYVADVIVQMMDESRQKISINYDTRVEHLISEICSRLRMNTTGWTIMILGYVDENTVNTMLSVLDNLGFDLLSIKIIQSTLYAIWHFPQFYIVPEATRVWDIWDPETKLFPKLIFRRRMISVSELLYPHPSHAHLTYKQMLWEFRSYPIPETMVLLASIIAKILVSERWSPTLKSIHENQPNTTQLALYDNQAPRTVARTLCITYSMLESCRYIPVAFAAQHPRFQDEWQARVQKAYIKLDLDEHQLLAINSLFVEMRNLKCFGALFWLVAEPTSSIFNALLSNSKLRLLYENTSVSMDPGLIRSRLGYPTHQCTEEYSTSASNASFEFPQTDDVCLQPMVLTPYDISQFEKDIRKELDTEQKTQDGKKYHAWYHRLKSRVRLLRYKEKLASCFATSTFALGIERSQHIHQPLWMSLNSKGLQFCPAVSLGYTNWIQLNTVFIPSSRMFACETLWAYHSDSDMWTYGGLALCVDLRQSDADAPEWSLIVLVPLTCSPSAIHAALTAFVPSLLSYNTLENQPDEDHVYTQQTEPTTDVQYEYSEY